MVELVGQPGELLERAVVVGLLPGGAKPCLDRLAVDAITTAITTLPAQLRRSLTWDQGTEMAQHAQLRVEAGLPVFFCDPQSPWQRGTNENTNGLLRQYFPRGTDLARHTADDLAAVAATLNGRPRKTLGWRTPAEALNEHLTTDTASLPRCAAHPKRSRKGTTPAGSSPTDGTRPSH